MKPILFIKGDDSSNVRLSKYISYFTSKQKNVIYWGWNRVNINKKRYPFYKEKYLICGGGFGAKKTILFYPLWMSLLFFNLLFKKKVKNYNIITVNFDSALPTYLASRFRSFKYIYEIHDDFALSYNFPNYLKHFINIIDAKIKERSRFIIHVDKNRVKINDKNYIIIENSPFDYLNTNVRDYQEIKQIFAVIGNISDTRGIDQIYKFAKDNKNIKLLVVGKFYNKKFKKTLLTLPNIIYRDFMPQKELFKLLRNCCSIFSLYNPSLEINRLAASNKVYDSMMMGIPVITNKEVINSSFIESKNIGLIINYRYDDTWEELANPTFTQKAIKLGKNARKLFLKEYSFDKLIEKNLLDKLF